MGIRRRRTEGRANFVRESDASAAVRRNAKSQIGRIELIGLNGLRDGGSELRAVVVRVIVVLEPDGTEVGLKEAATPAGNALVVKVTLPVNVPPTGAVVIVKFADWPAVTV